ncbi:MAG: hypothetical protein PVSMB7_06550 [Chloroflexota bacterium]
MRMAPVIRCMAIGAVLIVAPLSIHPSRAQIARAVPDYWHTDGSYIVDSRGRMVRIAAVNWFGMENRYGVPEGLQAQPLDVLMSHIRTLGFNAIRLPYSNATIESNPVVTQRLRANPQLAGMRALDILDRIVSAASRHNLRIILDNARSTLGDEPEPNGLWYTPDYPESAWIHDWTMLASRYRDNPTVVGVDLRNEPHTAPPGPWSLRTYLGQGATWGPWWGVDNRVTDWRLAAERAGDAVLAINPHLLIIVEGIQQYPDPAARMGVDSSWWASILQAAARYPVRLSVPHQLVYSPHEYGPYKYRMPQFGPRMSYRTVTSVWNRHWGYLLERYHVPIFIGEFGTCGFAATCVRGKKPGSQGLWFSFLMRYLKEHPQVGWAFWALNANNSHDKLMTNYILMPDWRTVRLPALIEKFHLVERTTAKNRSRQEQTSE